MKKTRNKSGPQKLTLTQNLTSIAAASPVDIKVKGARKAGRDEPKTQERLAFSVKG